MSFQSEWASSTHTERAQAEIALLYRLSDAVNSAQSLEVVYEIALDTIERAFGISRAAVLLFDDAGTMRFTAWRHLSPRYRAAVEGHSPWSRDDPNPQPIFVPDVRAAADLADYRDVLAQEGIGAVAFVPLVHQGRLLGKFMLYWPARQAFEERAGDMARCIADQVSSAIGWRIGQQEKEKLIAELSETVRLNELFTAVVGHDLRNPLGALLTSAQLVFRRSTDQAIIPQVKRILSCGGRMTRLIDQLLDFSRVRSGGGIPCDPRQTDLGQLCREALDELPGSAPSRPVTFETSGDLAGRWDPDRLAQVISNLVGNAIRHGDAGPISVVADGSSPCEVRLRITNRGTIPAELLPLLFHPFRGAQQTNFGSQGLGLGLYITQQIVAAHGGAIAVSSVPAEGTTFDITLPRSFAAPRS